MSDASEEPRLDLDSVAEPVAPAPDVPDEKTQEERQDTALMQKLASSAAFRSIYVSEREVARLKKELDDANSERRDLQGRVFDLAPENALLQQSMHDLRGNFTIAALLLTGGSTLVSIAGAISKSELEADHAHRGYYGVDHRIDFNNMYIQIGKAASSSGPETARVSASNSSTTARATSSGRSGSTATFRASTGSRAARSRVMIRSFDTHDPQPARHPSRRVPLATVERKRHEMEETRRAS
jgi:hypothetical protein